MINDDVVYLTQLRILSQRLKTERINRKLSVIELSVITNVAEKTIYNIEGGVGNVTIRTLSALAAALNLSIKDLL